MAKANRRIMRRFVIDEISAVDVPAQKGAVMTLMKRGKPVVKMIGNKGFLASDFAYVEDENDPKTWAFLLTNKPGGEPTKKCVDYCIKQMARYHIPDDGLESVLDKIREAWQAAYAVEMAAGAQMPVPIAESDEEIAARAEASMTDEVDPNEGIGDDGDEIPEDDEDEAAAAAAAEEEMDPAAMEEEADPAADPAAEADPMMAEEEDPAAAAKPKPKKKPQPRTGTLGTSPAAKRLASAIVKRYIDPYEGAKTFAEVVAACKEEEINQKISAAAWPLLSALDTSLRSVVYDKQMKPTDKQTAMRTSVEGFLAAIKEAWPEVEEALEKRLNDGTATGDDSMKLVRKKLREDDETGTVNKAGDAAIAELKKGMADIGARLTKAEAEKAELTARAETAEAIAKMSASERTYYDGLKKDETAKAAFVKMDAKARKAAIAKSEDDDETVELDGETIRKSAVGEQSFKVMKRQAERMARLEKQAQEEREARLNAEYEQQAEEEMSHLPGTVAEKAAVLKALDAIEDEKVQASLSKMLSAGDKAVSAAYERIGTIGGSDQPVEKSGGAGIHPFQKRIAEIKSRDKCGHTKALQTAREEHPDEFEDWQEGAEA